MAVWKNGLESKRLKVNMGQTKIMISGWDLHTLQTSGKYPCAICKKGVGKNWIFCSRCSFWVHVVDNFVYFGDCICPGGSCELATFKRCRSAWGKCKKLLPLLTCKAIF